MIRKNTFNRNARRNVRRAENETSMRSRNRRFRRYEEDEKEGKEENLIDVVEVSDIVDKSVDALGEYGISEIEYEGCARHAAREREGGEGRVLPRARHERRDD